MARLAQARTLRLSVIKLRRSKSKAASGLASGFHPSRNSSRLAVVEAPSLAG
jgi:hypothetical protein